MDPRIVKLARLKFRELSERFDGFIHVILDDWRGYRLIYDVEPAFCSKHGCSECPLSTLLEDEPDGLFTAKLLPASREDQQLFGPQRFLNCRSFEQYQDCYVAFLLKKCTTEEEIFSELDLVKNICVIYARYRPAEEQEVTFRKNVMAKILALCSRGKGRMINRYLAEHPNFFDPNTAGLSFTLLHS